MDVAASSPHVPARTRCSERRRVALAAVPPRWVRGTPRSFLYVLSANLPSAASILTRVSDFICMTAKSISVCGSDSELPRSSSQSRFAALRVRTSRILPDSSLARSRRRVSSMVFSSEWRRAGGVRDLTIGDIAYLSLGVRPERHVRFALRDVLGTSDTDRVAARRRRSAGPVRVRPPDLVEQDRRKIVEASPRDGPKRRARSPPPECRGNLARAGAGNDRSQTSTLTAALRPPEQKFRESSDQGGTGAEYCSPF